MMNIGIIGVGNMGYAIVKGISESFDMNKFFYYDINDVNINRMINLLGRDSAKNIEELAKNTQIIILAVKPKTYSKVLKQLKPVLNDKHILISIAPGISIEAMKKIVGETRIVRSMPNTPAQVLHGMSAITFSKDEYSVEEKEYVTSIFESFGKCLVVDENQLSGVVALSGSSPAYFYIMIEAMADAGVSFGLSREQAYLLATQSMIGSGQMILRTGEHPAILKDKVCSPAGATIEAVKVLEAEGFRASVMKAMQACGDKANKMAEKINK